MRKVEQELDLKTHLVSEICTISTCYISCVHRHHCSSTIKSSFIDWYRVLGVKDDDGIDVIRKKYLKLALQLHPDKNKHPKTEIAFKLVSEAYTCLSDTTKRKAFNLERWNNFCIECNKIPYKSFIPSNSNPSKLGTKTSTTRSRSHKILRGLKDIRDRFKEEARVIENCLRTNSELRKESPIFDPADYTFQGYPHTRNKSYTKHEKSRYSKARNFSSFEGRWKYETPVFEIRTDRGMCT